MTTQKRYETIALLWGKVPIQEIKRRTGYQERDIHVLVYRMRKHGVPIPKIVESPRKKGDRGGNVDYEKIINLLQEKL